MNDIKSPLLLIPGIFLLEIPEIFRLFFCFIFIVRTGEMEEGEGQAEMGENGWRADGDNGVDLLKLESAKSGAALHSSQSASNFRLFS